MTRPAFTVAAASWLGLTVLLQAQSPAFEDATPIQIGRGSGQLTLVDTNGDKHLDLVVHRFEHGVQVLLGNGHGQFSVAPGDPLDQKVEPAAIALGDVVADGQPDLIVAFKDKDNEYLQVFHGDGQGRFGPGSTKRYATHPSFEFYKPAIKLADVDGNGTTDIITSNGRRNTIEILLGNVRTGDGPAFTAAPPVALTAGSNFYTFGVDDFDADGRADLVTTFDSTSTRVELRKGVGNGRFLEPSGGVVVRAGARLAAVADVNADARPDVVVNHSDSGWMSILLNDGRGSLAHAPQSPRDLGREAWGVVVSDVNRDKRPDVVAATVNSRLRPYESRVAVLLGDSFAAAPGSPFQVGDGAYQLAVGDVNEDGKPDVVTSSFETDSMSVLLGR
jgi:hypothetical protein